MPTVAQTLQERLYDALAALELPSVDSAQVVPTADPRNGDYQTSIAMVLAKALRENPRALAGRIAEKINFAGLLSRLFLGFFVNPVLYEMVAREGDVLQV